MDFEYLAQLLFPDIMTTPDDMEKKYPARNLPEGAKVTRFAPSPTGYMHLGNLYGALTDERLAHQSNGVFYLRIEDTDAKREVEGGVGFIIDALESFGIKFDEGATKDGDMGNYGPYRQSEREKIYKTYAKQLVREGKAYPCFCTEEELALMRERQEAEKADFGYYGKWAIWRDASIEKIEAELKEKGKFVLRFHSDGSLENKFKFTDMIKGAIDVTENTIDHVILKSDGIPTYHFAHAVDDHLMRTTHVVRDESWLSTLPFHLQLFKALGFKPPKYCHTAQVMKPEGQGKRKLSKRKDPEAFVSYYTEQGYPVQAVIEYLTTLLNSNFEEWRIANPIAPLDAFMFTTKKMATSGCLFDFAKLNDISKNVISKMSTDEIYAFVTEWAKKFDTEFFETLSENPDYAKAILSIGRGGAKPRKDIAYYSEVKEYMGFFYDKYFKYENNIGEAFEKFDINDVRAAVDSFKQTYNQSDDSGVWFDKIKQIAGNLQFAPEMKLYKKNPDEYKGNVGDISSFIRVCVTGKHNSPDMYEVMQIMGTDMIMARIDKAMQELLK